MNDLKEQELLNYNRIADAIAYIRLHFKEQPNLDEVAEKINLSPYHFQRLFGEWAGVSPKKFLQFTSIEYAKSILQSARTSLSEVADLTGLSGAGRLHDLFISIEGMTPGEYKNGGEGLSINYNYENSPFGELIVASTPKGICFIAFVVSREKGLHGLRQLFPNALYREVSDQNQINAMSIFAEDWGKLNKLKLHLKGTDFQLKVWQALLKIPFGQLASYGSVATQINRPLASRAVGTAIGSNPVAFLIPCHRVIQASGAFGNYMWGSDRKKAIIGWEASRLNR